MNNSSKKLVPLSRDSVQLIKGLIIGKILTIAVMGGLWLLIKEYLAADSTVYSTQDQKDSSTDAVVGSTFESVNDVPIGSFKYSGSTAWAPIGQVVDSLIQSDRPEFQLQYVPTEGSPGSSAGIRMLLENKLDFAKSSRPLTSSEYTLARKKGFTLKQTHVATDGVAVVVNPNLNVPGLTVDQLQKIYRGEITNWKQLGGKDIAIVPFSQEPENADAQLFSGQLLNKQQLGNNIQYIYSTTEALRRVSKTPGGVYYGSARAVVPQCTVKPLPLGITQDKLVAPYSGSRVKSNQCPQQRNRVNYLAFDNGTYPLTSKLFVVTKHNNNREEKIGKAYTKLLLTSEGQKTIAEAGFVPVHSKYYLSRRR